MLPFRWQDSWPLTMLLAGLLLAGCKATPPAASAHSVRQVSGGPLLQEQAAYDVRHYDLSLRVDPVKKTHLHALYEDRRGIRNQHAVVPDQPTGIEEMDRNVGNDVYHKGAWVVHMLRYLVGRDQTLTVLRRFAYPTPEMEKYTDGRACRFVSTADFIRRAEEVSGRDLGWFFDLHLKQPKLPKLVSEIHDDKLSLRWETPKGYVFPMPVEIEVNGQLERVEMPDGWAELSGDYYAAGRLDPQLWILKESRPVEIESADRPEAVSAP